MKSSIPTCYILFSGGLDSRLALKIMQEQQKDANQDLDNKVADIIDKKSDKKDITHTSKFEIQVLYYHLPFLKDIRNEIEQFCKEQKAELKIFDYTKGELFQEYLKVISKPKYYRGTSMNPCIDCHMFITNEAKKLLNPQDFIVTGDVIGERPMSQYFKAMQTIDKETGLSGKILRPLSAKLLDETIVEKNKLIDRGKLFDISGRCRKPQMALANKYKITYPHPAGGCLLCEKVYGERLKDLFKRMKIKDFQPAKNDFSFLSRKKIEEITPRDIELLKIGRHFFFPEFNIIVGRNEKENTMLEQLKDKNEKIFTLKTLPGPSVLLQFKITEESIKQAKELLLKFSKNKDDVIEN